MGVARAVDRLVLADVDVVGVGRESGAIEIGNAREVLVLGGSDKVRGAVELRFLEGLLRPVARHDVVGDLVAHEVHRNCRELLRGAALQKEHAVVVGDGHEIADVLLGGLDDALERRRAMGHFHDRHARPVVIEHLRRRGLQDLLGKHCGTCRKVEHPTHKRAP